jgi:hypothetical protein
LPSRTAVRPVLLSPSAMPGVRQCLPSIHNCPAAKGTRGHSILGLLIGFKTRLALFFHSPMGYAPRRGGSGNTRGLRLVWLLRINGGLK